MNDAERVEMSIPNHCECEECEDLRDGYKAVQKENATLKDELMVYMQSVETLGKERDELSNKIRRTVNAAYHALLEMTAWLGIPEKKRKSQIEEYMSNVKYCAEHDLRHIDKQNYELAYDTLEEKYTKAIASLNEIAGYVGDYAQVVAEKALTELGEKK